MGNQDLTWEIIRVASRSHFIKLELFELVNYGIDRVASRSHFIKLELFELVNYEIDRVATVIPKALLVINQNQIFRNVAVDINIEKR